MKEDEIRAPVEKNVSVFNNLRSCPRGKYLERARSFGNGPSIFLVCELIFPSVKFRINPA